MKDVEERLRSALHAEADRRPVDTAALERQVRARLSRRAPRPTGRGTGPLRRATLPLVAAAAAAAAVAGTVGVVDRLNPDGPRGSAEDPVPGAGPVVGGVEDAFTCPSRGRTVFDADNDDDSFLPRLTRDLQPAEDAYFLPRYELERLDDRRVRVRFGNADGTLASVAVFRPAADGYEPAAITKCTNGPGPRGPDVEPGTLPPADDQFTAADFAPGAVQLMDSLTYDVNGTTLRRSVWAEPCGRTLCLVAGEPTASITGRFPPDEVEPSDATNFLYSPDTIDGKRTGYRLIVSYDGGDALRAVSWKSRNGDSTEVEPVTGGWQGRLFAMVVPRDAVSDVTLRPRQGPAQVFPADEIRQ